MHIVAVFNVFPTLSETFIYLTLENLQRQGHHVTIAARRKGKSPHHLQFKDVVYLPVEDKRWYFRLHVVTFFLLEALIHSNRDFIRLCRYIYNSRGSFRARLRLISRLAPLLAIHADKTYFVHGSLAALYMEYFAIRPSYVSLRGSDINIGPLLSEDYRGRLRQALLQAHGIHCVSKAIQKKAENLCAQILPHASVIYTAINPLFLSAYILSNSSENHKIRIVSVGRLDWRKGFEHGIMAIRQLVDSGLWVSWDIWGEGNYRIALEWAIRDFGLEDYVFLKGAADQLTIRSALQESHIYFHPAVLEELSNAVLEAMAVGLPVVVSDVGGMKEAIKHGENGYLFLPRDWRTMATILKQLAEDPQLRLRVGQRAKRSCSSVFTQENQQRGFEDLFTERGESS